MWVARDKNGELWIYRNKPFRYMMKMAFASRGNNDIYLRLDESMFKSVKWKNSPQEVELKK